MRDALPSFTKSRDEEVFTVGVNSGRKNASGFEASSADTYFLSSISWAKAANSTTKRSGLVETFGSAWRECAIESAVFLTR